MPPCSQAASTAWESPAHRDNILAPEFNEIGLGLAKGDNDTVYFAQVFAMPLK